MSMILRGMAKIFPFVMPGLVPGIHVFDIANIKDVDARHKRSADDRSVQER